MANRLPKANPLGLHIADRALNPILSSSQSPQGDDTTSQLRRQYQSLSTLTTTAINAYDTACRLGLGTPQRIMVETQSLGPVVLTSYLESPGRGRAIIEQSPESRRLLGENGDAGSASEPPVNGLNNVAHEPGDAGELESRNRSPLVIATVVASSAAEIGEARRSAVRLERTGRDFQREWARKQDDDPAALTATGGDDG
ncbi:hypothetical protein BKA65DRAFT_548312 [Rhexocercosporidium sp. MPI-PUGE-AT-0058]|nr:hypothetical protein BKA65DRAFT_548312 [Rhexocercosporidium sp. MPI-PUGE-AT-0058]